MTTASPYRSFVTSLTSPRAATTGTSRRWGPWSHATCPAATQRKTLGDMLAVLARERLAWVLSAFYFLTFGGFVAFSIYLPTLLRPEFGLTAADPRIRPAGLVLLAPPRRPAGGCRTPRSSATPSFSTMPKPGGG